MLLLLPLMYYTLLYLISRFLTKVKLFISTTYCIIPVKMELFCNKCGGIIGKVLFIYLLLNQN